jgi:hypothetical protein
MNEGFEHPTGKQKNETSEEPIVEDLDTFNDIENAENQADFPEDTPEERVEALEEGIRLTEIGRTSAVAELDKFQHMDWSNNLAGNIEYALPEIQNRISRSEQSISSSKLDIKLITTAPESPEQEAEVIKSFISGQVLEGKTAGLKEKLSSIGKKESDYTERVDRNHKATEKIQTELAEIETAIKSGDGDTERLKLNRRDVLVDMNGVSDRYKALMSEKTDIDVLTEEREIIQSQIDEILDAGVTDEELPTTLQEDPNFAACLKEADSYASEDSQRFSERRNYNPEETAIKLFRDRFPQKSAYYDRNSAEKQSDSIDSLNMADLSNDSDQLLTKEQIEALQTEDGNGIEDASSVDKEVTVNTIRESIAAGTINSEPDFEKLKTEPIIDSRRFYDVEPPRGEKSSFEFVDTSKIVGRPNADNYEDGWSHEYDERGGRISEIIDQINNPDNESGIERIFHTEDGTSDRIKLASYEGPAGPIYSVFDGTHRIAGIKASGLEKMPVEIYRTEYPYEKTSTDPEDITDWQDKIDRGFITGSIEKVETQDGERSMLRVEAEVLPWIRARNQNDVFKINQIYEQQYPGALEKVGFPTETLTDKSALWAYMDGNFDQWKQLQENDAATLESNAELSELPKSITTANGSVYSYLEDGTTQRFKSAEGEIKEPQNVLTFIPRIDRITDWENYDRLPEWIRDNGNDQVMEILAADYIHNPKKRVVLTNELNEVVRSNTDALTANSLLLQFVDVETNQTEFALPVSSKPEVGDTTYDARYFEKDGKEHISSHIGSAVTDIEY